MTRHHNALKSKIRRTDGQIIHNPMQTQRHIGQQQNGKHALKGQLKKRHITGFPSQKFAFQRKNL